jgi:ABC-type antimicrobial peptide transport system permease subunit
VKKIFISLEKYPELSMTSRSKIKRSLDLISLTIDVIVNSRRLILPSIFGLILALAVIAEAQLLVESSREDLFQSTVFQSSSENDKSADINIELNGFYPEVHGAKRYTDFSHYEEMFSNGLGSEFGKYFSEYFWFTNLGISLMKNSSALDLINFVVTTSSSTIFFDKLNQSAGLLYEGRFPQNGDEVLLIRPKVANTSTLYNTDLHAIELNSTIGLTIPNYNYYLLPDNNPFFKDPNNRPNKSVNIVGIIEASNGNLEFATQDPMTQLLSRYLNYSWSYPLRYAIVSPPLSIEGILNATYSRRVINALEMDSARHLTKFMWGKMFFDRDAFNVYDSDSEVLNLLDLLYSLGDSIDSFGYNSIITSSIIDELQTFKNRNSDLISGLLLLGAPLLGISLYLMTYAFGLIRRQKQDQLAILKTRGGSRRQIIGILMGEMLFSTIVAITLGFALSILLTSLVLRSTAFLEFLGSPKDVRTTIGMFQNLIIAGILLAFSVNIFRIIRMSRQDIEETAVPIDVHVPFWKRYYLDVSIFIFGIVIWIGAISFVRGISSAERTPSVMNLVQIFLIIAPFLFFIGFITITARIFYNSLKWLAKIAWRLERDIWVYALNNVRRYKHRASRAALVLTLTIAFSIVSSTLMVSLDQSENLRLYYSSGADISFSLDGSPDPFLIDKLVNISHISNATVEYTARSESRPELGARDDVTIHFLFVDPIPYAETIKSFPEFELSSSLKKVFRILEENDTSVLLLDKNLNELNLKIGRLIEKVLYSSYLNYNNRRAFRIAGTFKYWPSLNPETTTDFESDIYMISSLPMFSRLLSLGFIIPDSISARCLINVDSKKNIGTVTESVENLTTNPLKVPWLNYDNYLESFDHRFNLSILNSALIICLTISIVSMVMFAFFIYIERGREMAVERALGLTRFQSGQLLLFEASTILIFGILFGLVSGIFFSSIFFQVMQIQSLTTPFVLTFPTQIIPILLGVFFVSGGCSLVPIIIISQKDISRMLKVE